MALYQLYGKQYAYPLDFPNQELYYNVELFEQAGVKAPPGDLDGQQLDLDRFLDAARRLTKETGPGRSGAS